MESDIRSRWQASYLGLLTVAVLMVTLGVHLMPSIDRTRILPHSTPASGSLPSDVAAGTSAIRHTNELLGTGGGAHAAVMASSAPATPVLSTRSEPAPVLPRPKVASASERHTVANASTGATGGSTLSDAAQRKQTPRSEPASLCLHGRQAPTIFILGCQKCGTTSLIAQMEQALSWRDVRVQTGRAYTYEPPFYDKEKHFFSTDSLYAKGRMYYLNHFPACHRPRAAVCDATPNYLNVPAAAERLSRLYGQSAGNLTFILILRDPVRALGGACAPRYLLRVPCCTY